MKNPQQIPLNHPWIPLNQHFPIVSSAFFSALPAPGPDLRHHLHRQAAGRRDEASGSCGGWWSWEWSHPETMVGWIGDFHILGTEWGGFVLGLGWFTSQNSEIFDGFSPTMEIWRNLGATQGDFNNKNEGYDGLYYNGIYHQTRGFTPNTWSYDVIFIGKMRYEIMEYLGTVFSQNPYDMFEVITQGSLDQRKKRFH